MSNQNPATELRIPSQSIDFAPWGADQKGFFEYVASQASYDGVFIGLSDLKSPQPDEILAADSCVPSHMSEWCVQPYDQNPIFRKAIRRGVAVVTPNGSVTDRQMWPNEHVMIHMLPESLIDNRWWWLLMIR